jgi:hypothetical protein
VGQYVSVRAVLGGQETIRYYSPISRPDAPGYLDLLLKVDATGGAMSHHLNSLQPGDTLEFKGPLGGISLNFAPSGSLGRIRRLGCVDVPVDEHATAACEGLMRGDRALLPCN